MYFGERFSFQPQGNSFCNLVCNDAFQKTNNNNTTAFIWASFTWTTSWKIRLFPNTAVKTSVRHVLRALTKEQVLDDEGLSTPMCEAEAIVNGRPLTKVSDDPRDLDALTPNHLLLLRAGSRLPLGIFQKEDIYCKRRWKQVQYMADIFWSVGSKNIYSLYKNARNGKSFNTTLKWVTLYCQLMNTKAYVATWKNCASTFKQRWLCTPSKVKNQVNDLNKTNRKTVFAWRKSIDIYQDVIICLGLFYNIC